MTDACSTKKVEALSTIGDIVAEAMCIGCGLCQGVAGKEHIRMVKARTGYLHPEVCGNPSDESLEAILSSCPSRRLHTLPNEEITPDTNIDPVWGPYRWLVHGWARDPKERFEGSTGGILTALAVYLLKSGKVSFVLHARAPTNEPTFGARHLSFTRTDVLEASGSRYGPTAICVDINDILDRGQQFAVIGKPCDISALRNYGSHDSRIGSLVKYWLTFACGGFMPPEGTADFLAARNIVPGEVVSFRYRGRGFPGATRVETRDGRVLEATYYDFWGENLDRWTLPHRCKICPDSIGESADIVAADPWPGGGPDLSDQSDPGTNVIIARTDAGVELLTESERNGAIVLGAEATIDQMNDYQPHQVARKYTSWARLEGLRAEGRSVPETHELRIEALAGEMETPFIREQTEGTRRRVREGKASEERPAGFQ